jgi:cell division protein FtsX
VNIKFNYVYKNAKNVGGRQEYSIGVHVALLYLVVPVAFRISFLIGNVSGKKEVI